MNIVNWFEIPVKDIERAKKFYESVFDLKIEIHPMEEMKMGFFPSMDDNSYGVTGSLVQSKGYTPSTSGVVIYFSVNDITGILEKVSSNAGKIIKEKMSIGEYGFVGYFKDPEGNKIGLHSMK